MSKASAPHRWMVYDVDFKTGKIRWSREMQNGEPPILRHVKNSFASESAVTDGQRVYVYFGSIGLVAALDLKGNVRLDARRWRPSTRRSSSAPARRRSSTRAGSTSLTTTPKSRSWPRSTQRPVRTIWRVDREERGNWSTPFVWENDQRTEIVTTGTVKVRSY